uniref:Transposase n=1 Tax=Panagrolaimus superbus TaxID=310955 RepID=A0A914Y2R6_9BILA
MARIVEELLKNFGISIDKIFLILRDGASAVVKLCNLLGIDSSHCFAHLLQLAINDALKIVTSFDELLKKIKKVTSTKIEKKTTN